MIKKTCENESKRTNKQINPSKLLIGMFMEYTKNGLKDFFKTLSKTEIIDILNKNK